MVVAKKDNDLIYDVGMHQGGDTDFYLKKGFKVIGFEANPELVKYCEKRFESEIKNGKLIIVKGAIIDFTLNESENSTINFFKNKNKTDWGTVVKSWANRNEMLGTSNEIIEVNTVNFSKCLKQYGIPYYMKIDIEGCDTVCLKALTEFEVKPDYLSIESDKIYFNSIKEEFNLLTKLGYTSFKLINQAKIKKQKQPLNSLEKKDIEYSFLLGTSGLFGKDLPYEWLNKKQILSEYVKIFVWYKLFGDYGLLKRGRIGKKLRTIIKKNKPNLLKNRWYDTHAKHSSVK